MPKPFYYPPLNFACENTASRWCKPAEAMQQHQPDLLIIDTEQTPAESVAFLQSLKKDQPKLPVIMVSPLEDEEELWKAMQYGADDFVTKPFKLIELVLRVRKLLNLPERDTDGSTLRINM